MDDPQKKAKFAKVLGWMRDKTEQPFERLEVTLDTIISRNDLQIITATQSNRSQTIFQLLDKGIGVLVTFLLVITGLCS